MRAKIAGFFGTLQAGFTDFHYLRPIWRKTTRKEALIGVGITGIATKAFLALDETEAAKHAMISNEETAEAIGINKAARVTTIKPSGTTSCVLGTSSGIHAWHSNYYIRNIQCNAGFPPVKSPDMTTEQYMTEVVTDVRLREGADDIFNYFRDNFPNLIKIMDTDLTSAVIGVPIKAPDGAITRKSESALDLLERVKRFNLNWVKQGHRSGDNTNNVSATISIKPEEWQLVGEWMWNNRDSFNGLSVLHYDGGEYKDAPFTECTEGEYEQKIKYVDSINLSEITEEDDNTDLRAEAACAGNSCEII